jgi:hypothetical protein
MQMDSKTTIVRMMGNETEELRKQGESCLVNPLANKSRINQVLAATDVETSKTEEIGEITTLTGSLTK